MLNILQKLGINNEDQDNNDNDNENNENISYINGAILTLTEITTQIQTNLTNFHNKKEPNTYIITPTSLKPFLVLNQFISNNTTFHFNFTYHAKTILSLLSKSNFPVLCEPSITIQFIDNLLQIIYTTSTNQDKSIHPLFITLLYKVHSYINYLLTNVKDKSPLLECKQKFPIIHSLAFDDFDNLIENSKLSDEISPQGNINNSNVTMIDTFISIMTSLLGVCEQLELFPQIINQVFSDLLMNPLEMYEDTYAKLGNFLLEYTIYNKYSFTLENKNKAEIKHKLILINDNTEVNDVKSFSEITNKIYSYTYHSDIMDMYQDSYTAIVLYYIDKLIPLKKCFSTQFIIYKLLKAFILNNQNNLSKGDASILLRFVPENLNNLAQFKDPTLWNKTNECREFTYYILSNRNSFSSIIPNIKSISSLPLSPIDICKVPLNDIDIHYGLFSKIEIEQRGMKKIVIDTLNDNVMLIFELKIDGGYDIKVKMYKLDCSDEYGKNEMELFGDFNKVSSVDTNDNTECPVKFVGHFKKRQVVYVELDNSYSWFTNKVLYYRYSLLHLVE